MSSFVIDPEFKSLVRPLTGDEHAQLEENLVAEGCRDPLVIWQEEGVLLDGHNRHVICTAHGVPYTTKPISLPDRDAAKAWVIRNQLGRRNLTPDETSYYRGSAYNHQKRQGKRTDLTSHQSEEKLQDTSSQLADQHKVSKATIQRDGAYARAVDTLAEVVGPEVRQAILASTLQLPQHDVRRLARAAQNQPEVVAEVISATQKAETKTLARQAVNRGLLQVRRAQVVAEVEGQKPTWQKNLASCSWWKACLEQFPADAWHLVDLWGQFCTAEGRTLTPFEAEEDDQARFTTWLVQWRESQQRMLAANREMHRQSYFGEVVGHLHELIDEYGTDLVWDEVGRHAFGEKVVVVNGKTYDIWLRTLTTLDRLGQEMEAIYPTLDEDERNTLAQMIDVGLVSLDRAMALLRPPPLPPEEVSEPRLSQTQRAYDQVLARLPSLGKVITIHGATQGTDVDPKMGHKVFERFVKEGKVRHVEGEKGHYTNLCRRPRAKKQADWEDVEAL
jgi:hypothetical protein